MLFYLLKDNPVLEKCFPKPDLLSHNCNFSKPSYKKYKIKKYVFHSLVHLTA